MQHRLLAAASVAALFALAACNNEPEVVSTNGADPQAAELAKAKPVELPPSIKASRTYRCKDNSLFYADFYTNNTVQVSADRHSAKTVLTAAAPGEAYTADGYTLSGDGPEVTYSAPGKGSQTCKA